MTIPEPRDLATPEGKLAVDTPAAPPAVPQPGRDRKAPTDFGPVQVLDYTNLAGWQWDAGTVAGLIPPADVDGRR